MKIRVTRARKMSQVSSNDPKEIPITAWQKKAWRNLELESGSAIAVLLLMRGVSSSALCAK